MICLISQENFNVKNPMVKIYNFEGVLNYNGVNYASEAENLLLRGMSVKNTELLYGLVVFTGHETKVNEEL